MSTEDYTVQGAEFQEIIPRKPISSWSLEPSFQVAFMLTSPAPCLLHRIMQRLILGIYWKKL